MARQIIGQELEISLPEYTGEVSDYPAPNGIIVTEKFLVAKRRKLRIADVQVETLFEEVPVDLTGLVKGFRFVVYFAHPGREVPMELYNPKDTNCGIVSVSLEAVRGLFINLSGASKSYQDILAQFLADDLSSKRWVFHPRYQQKKQEAEMSLDKKIRRINRERSVTRERQTQPASYKAPRYRQKLVSFDDPDPLLRVKNAPEIKRLARYECIMCHAIWDAWEPGLNPCPNCDTHLYSRRIKYIEN